MKIGPFRVVLYGHTDMSDPLKCDAVLWIVLDRTPLWLARWLRKRDARRMG